MPKNKKTVHCKISFDENGDIVGVEGNGKSIGKKSLKDDPVHGVVGMCTVMVTADDDPCIVQGNVKYCWK